MKIVQGLIFLLFFIVLFAGIMVLIAFGSVIILAAIVIVGILILLSKFRILPKRRH